MYKLRKKRYDITEKERELVYTNLAVVETAYYGKYLI